MVLLERNGLNQVQINCLMRKSCNSIAYAQVLRVVRFKPRKYTEYLGQRNDYRRDLCQWVIMPGHDGAPYNIWINNLYNA